MSIIDDSYEINHPYFKQNGYLNWLGSFTIDETLPEERRPQYGKLLHRLWHISWEGNAECIGNDRDRERDGFGLRVQYEREIYGKTMVDATEIYGPVRVLEVLLSLSMHMYDLMLDTDIYNSVSRWFWEIMGNVGLDILDDDVYDKMDGDSLVSNVVLDILERNPDSAVDGWFSVREWREMEVWYQMHEYISEYF